MCVWLCVRVAASYIFQCYSPAAPFFCGWNNLKFSERVDMSHRLRQVGSIKTLSMLSIELFLACSTHADCLTSDVASITFKFTHSYHFNNMYSIILFICFQCFWFYSCPKWIQKRSFSLSIFRGVRNLKFEFLIDRNGWSFLCFLFFFDRWEWIQFHALAFNEMEIWTKPYFEWMIFIFPNESTDCVWFPFV